MSKDLAYPHTIRDIVVEYLSKKERLGGEIKEFYTHLATINNAACVVGGYTSETLVRDPYVYERNGQHLLLVSAWRALYVRLNLDQVFSAKDENLFEQSLLAPKELTLENLSKAFGDYWENPRYYILKGLAEVFCSLDKFYKSHTNFGIGAKGLPKRVILNGFAQTASRGSDRLVDICRAMLQVTGEKALTNDERGLIRDKAFTGQDFELARLGLTVKVFANQNAHVHFNPRALKVVNDGLHEFYGTVLPDDSGERPSGKQASTEVSKDLQFYRTPKAVIEQILNSVHIKPGSLVLEPSCGDGAILDELVARGIKAAGIEVDAGRAGQARSKGHSVMIGNFLSVEPNPIYDAVVMNPPFVGRHYVKHVEHALKFLKDGGRLITILPSSAWYEHKLLKGRWTDLPIASFRESGTNVSTGYLVIRK
jgi:hypothetical protein